MAATEQSQRKDGLQVLLAVVQLTLLLFVLGLVFQVMNPHPAGWTPWRTVAWVTGSIAQLMVIASFVGGIVLADRGVPGRVWRRAVWVALPMAATVYLLGAVVEPQAEYRALDERGYSAEFLKPFGPDTPFGLVERLQYAIENPPDEISFSASRPFSIPPSYLAYLFASSFTYALAVYPLLLVGYFVGRRTKEVRVARRSVLRWASGLATATVFVATVAASGAWIRANPSGSGVLAALAPILVAVLVAVVVSALPLASEPSLEDPT